MHLSIENNHEDFRIIEKSEAIEYLSKFNLNLTKNISFVLETNKCWVYELPNSEIVVIAIACDKSLICKNRSVLDKFVADDHFPIGNLDNTIFSTHSEQLIRINTSFLKNKLILDDISNNKEVDLTLNSLEIYLKAIKLRKKSKDLEKFEIAFINVVGEYLRKERNGKWGLIKRYHNFNPYYEPVIITQDGFVLDFTLKAIDYIFYKGLDFKSFYRIPAIENSVITVASFESNRQKNYQLIILQN